MDKTYEPIATQTLGSAAASVIFGSIPQTYTDLVLVANGAESANQYVAIRFNNDTGSNYSQTRLYGDGTSAFSDRQTSVNFGRLSVGDPTNRFLMIASLHNYANSTTFKNWLSRTNTANNMVGAVIGLYRSTSAITTIEVLTVTADTFVVGSTFTLYGIKAA